MKIKVSKNNHLGVSPVDLADVYQRKHCDGRGTRERLRKWTRSP
jgi:hypothetical protein